MAANITAAIVFSGSARMFAPISSLRPGRALAQRKAGGKAPRSTPQSLRPSWSVGLDFCLVCTIWTSCASVIISSRLYQDASTLTEMVQQHAAMSRQFSSAGVLSYVTRHPLLLVVAADMTGLACGAIVLASLGISLLGCGKSINSGPGISLFSTVRYIVFAGLAAAVAVMSARVVPAMVDPQLFQAILSWKGGDWLQGIRQACIYASMCALAAANLEVLAKPSERLQIQAESDCSQEQRRGSEGGKQPLMESISPQPVPTTGAGPQEIELQKDDNTKNAATNKDVQQSGLRRRSGKGKGKHDAPDSQTKGKFDAPAPQNTPSTPDAANQIAAPEPTSSQHTKACIPVKRAAIDVTPPVEVTAPLALDNQEQAWEMEAIVRAALLMLWMCADLSVHSVVLVRGVARHHDSPRGFLGVATAIMSTPRLAHGLVCLGLLVYCIQKISGALASRGRIGMLALVGALATAGIVLFASVPEDSMPLPRVVGAGLTYGIRTALQAIWLSSVAGCLLGGGAPGLIVAATVIILVDAWLGGHFLTGANALLTGSSRRSTRTTAATASKGRYASA